MTAATLTPDALVTWGREVLEAAEAARCPDAAGKEAENARQKLQDAIEIYDAMARVPALIDMTEHYDVADHPEPRYEALRLAAEDVQEWAAELVRLFPAAAVEMP